jgi:hypothetical protein
MNPVFGYLRRDGYRIGIFTGYIVGQTAYVVKAITCLRTGRKKVYPKSRIRIEVISAVQTNDPDIYNHELSPDHWPVLALFPSLTEEELQKIALQYRVKHRYQNVKGEKFTFSPYIREEAERWQKEALKKPKLIIENLD